MGTNKELIKKNCDALNVPLIYNGGTKDLHDLKLSFESGVRAVAVGSYFVFYGKHKAVLITYPSEQIKDLINE